MAVAEPEIVTKPALSDVLPPARTAWPSLGPMIASTLPFATIRLATVRATGDFNCVSPRATLNRVVFARLYLSTANRSQDSCSLPRRAPGLTTARRSRGGRSCSLHLRRIWRLRQALVIMAAATSSPTGVAIDLVTLCRLPAKVGLSSSSCWMSPMPSPRARSGRSRARSRRSAIKSDVRVSARRQDGDPSSCTSLMISKFRWTRIGARPIEGSSMRRSFGRAINARPIATICCSPPESVPASCVRRSARSGKIE